MLSLLVLLAPMGAEKCSLKRNVPLLFDLNVSPTVRILQGNWPEARLVPHVAGLLIREVLGMKVEYALDEENGPNGVNASRMYAMLANDEADLALTLWPAKFFNSDRAAALSTRCPGSSTKYCMAIVGNQGYMARSGWFVPAKVSMVREEVADWSTVTNLYDPVHVDQLIKAHELPVVDLCQTHSLTVVRYNGIYNCSDGSWVLADSRCCPRAKHAHLPNTTSMAYNTACGYRPPCVALIVDDPTYDAGQNEGVVARLAKPIRVSGDDGQFVGIQIVYGNVSKEVVKAERKDKPLLVYSWVPRAEIMTPGRFVRITLESFYHCGAEELSMHQRGVTACDYPIEHVEKAVVWRLQEPSSTTASLFVNAFNLNATQLHDLLEIGDSLGVVRSSEPSATELDHIACLWLNDNTEAWEAWLPDVAFYSTALYQWRDWLISCGFTFFAVFCAIIAYFPIKERFKELKERFKERFKKRFKESRSGHAAEPYEPPAEPTTETAKWHAVKFPAKKTPPAEPSAKKKCYEKTLPAEPYDWQLHGRLDHNAAFTDTILRIWLVAPCREALDSQWRPVFIYLSEARRCLRHYPATHLPGCTMTTQVVLFALGQIFAAASTGFIEVLLFQRWLSNGLDKLSLEVTISCAVLMLTLKLIEWGFGQLPSGEKVVQEQLEARLLIKYREISVRDLKTKYHKFTEWEAKVDEESTLEDQFQQAITSTASQLANDCYRAALGVFSSLWVFVFSIIYLVYSAFRQGDPGDLLRLMTAAFVLAPFWLLISWVIVYLVKKVVTIEKDPKATAEFSVQKATALGGCMWICVYLLWAFGPILINPLKNEWEPGTDPPFFSKADLLTVLKVLETIGTSLIGIETHNTTMFKSSSKISTVGRLLDWTNKAEKLAVAKVRQRHRHPTEAKAAAEANPPKAEVEVKVAAEAKAMTNAPHLADTLESKSVEGCGAVADAAVKPPSPSKVHIEEKLHWNAKDASGSGGTGGGVGSGGGGSDAEAGVAAAESAEAKAAGGVTLTQTHQDEVEVAVKAAAAPAEAAVEATPVEAEAEVAPAPGEVEAAPAPAAEVEVTAEAKTATDATAAPEAKPYCVVA